jgi:hypothetical protein
MSMDFANATRMQLMNAVGEEHKGQLLKQKSHYSEQKESSDGAGLPGNHQLMGLISLISNNSPSISKLHLQY